MRTVPLNRQNEDKKRKSKAQQDRITRMVAIAIAFAGTFYFFIKLLFL